MIAIPHVHDTRDVLHQGWPELEGKKQLESKAIALRSGRPRSIPESLFCRER